MAHEKVAMTGCVELVNPYSLPPPWNLVVCYWMHHHPNRTFLPELESPGEYRLSWDDLRDILVAASVLSPGLTTH
jgi:hypothetical protein